MNQQQKNIDESAFIPNGSTANIQHPYVPTQQETHPNEELVGAASAVRIPQNTNPKRPITIKFIIIACLLFLVIIACAVTMVEVIGSNNDNDIKNPKQLETHPERAGGLRDPVLESAAPLSSIDDVSPIDDVVPPIDDVAVSPIDDVALSPDKPLPANSFWYPQQLISMEAEAEPDNGFPEIDYEKLTEALTAISQAGANQEETAEALVDISLSIGKAISVFEPELLPATETIELLNKIIFRIFGIGDNKGSLDQKTLLSLMKESFQVVLENDHMGDIQGKILNFNAEIKKALDAIIETKKADVGKMQTLYGLYQSLSNDIAGDIQSVVNFISEKRHSTDPHTVDVAVEQLHKLIGVVEFSYISFNLFATTVGDEKIPGVADTGTEIKKACNGKFRSLLDAISFLLKPTVSDITFMAAFYSGNNPIHSIRFLSEIFGVNIINPTDKFDKKFQLYHGDSSCMRQDGKYHCLQDGKKKYFLGYYVSTVMEWSTFHAEVNTEKSNLNTLSATEIYPGKYYLTNGDNKRYGLYMEGPEKTIDMPVAIFEVGSVLIITHAQEPHKYKSLYSQEETSTVDPDGKRVIHWKYGDPGSQGYWFVNNIQK